MSEIASTPATRKIAAILSAAEPVVFDDAPGEAALHDETPQPRLRADDDAPDPRPASPDDSYCDLDDDSGPSAAESGVDLGIVQACAAFDHSDTDNGQRLLLHFGQDLLVIQQEGVRNSDYTVWCGTHWDMVGGSDRALGIAQRVGGRIGLEAEYLRPTPREVAAINAAKSAGAIPPGDRSPDDEQAIIAGDKAQKAFENRKAGRRKFAVSSKNKARLDAMLVCAAPHVIKRPEELNADPMMLATLNKTLRFWRSEVVEADPDCPDPDVERSITVKKVGYEVIDGHRREDYLTRLLPVTFDVKATCPKWDAFLGEFQPVAPVRRFIQVFSGLGLLGLPVQKVLFHYGLGANGKSVFMETLMRIFGGLGVGLPAESLTGTGQAAGGQASPDLVRLYGARIVRVLELPDGVPVREELLKKLTGGEKIDVRGLFKGYFSFQPVFKAHMSGNGYPRIDGTDNGIWRRMAVAHWPVTIAEDRQRNFEDVVAEFQPEYSGILNWLIAGALAYLADGLQIPDEVSSDTKAYRDEMDPIGQFSRDCVEVAPGQDVTARTMYDAFVSWALANAKSKRSETKFGLVMKTIWQRDDTARVRVYKNCRLHDVPDRPDAQHHGARRDDVPDPRSPDDYR